MQLALFLTKQKVLLQNDATVDNSKEAQNSDTDTSDNYPKGAQNSSTTAV